MFIDILIIFMLVSIVIRARYTGLVRQLGAALGFAAGLAVGVLIQPHVVNLGHTTLSRALLSLLATLGAAGIGMQLGEYGGRAVKLHIHTKAPLNKIDGVLGSIAGAATLLAAVWLLTPLLASLPVPSLQRSLHNSQIIRLLDRSLPSAPDFVARLNRIVNPNGFPDVFAGLEHQPLRPDAPLPPLEGDLAVAVAKDRPSVVKLEGRGCGGIVEGSGFVAKDGAVVTNAHVVAGVARPVVIDTNGEHRSQAVWFDPDLDMAVLRITDGTKLAGSPLTIDTSTAAGQGTPGVVLGYPGGGGFTASPATILDQFTAVGRNIYGDGNTHRSVYELKATIIPGNSGGPLIDGQGEVNGLVFAQSTTYQQIGYALTMLPVAGELQQALAQSQPVATGSCAE